MSSIPANCKCYFLTAPYEPTDEPLAEAAEATADWEISREDSRRNR